MRRIWVLLNMDMGPAFPKASYSIRALEEWDCRQERYRTLTAKTYSGLMASGSIIRETDAASDWSYIPPGSIGISYLKFACSGKWALNWKKFKIFMSILIYCLASLSIVLAIGGLVSFGQTRHVGLLLSSLISIFFSGLAIHNVEWWPLIVGLITNWGVRIIVGDPGNRTDAWNACKIFEIQNGHLLAPNLLKI